jgi:AsmA-like C-terminal region
MTLQVNDQKLALSGQIANPVEPNIKILVTSPNLNLDRILPPAVRKLTADLQVQADRSQYKGLQFEKFSLDLLYKRGVIESYDMNFGIDKGHIATKGSADLRDLDHIRFTVDPNINALPLAKVTSALGIDNLPLNGPLTLKGRQDRKFCRETVFYAHISILFSGRLFKNLSNRGIPFETISVHTSFDKGTLNLGKFHFGSDAMTVDGQGTIDLIHQNLNMEALLVPITTVDETLHYVPIVGKAIKDVTKIQIDGEGPLENPKIRTAEAREIGKGIEITEPKTIIEDVGKGLKKIF